MNIDIISPINSLFASVILWIPKLLSFALILIVGYIIAWIIATVATRSLRRFGLDRRLFNSPAHNVVRRMTTSPSDLVGKLVYWLILIITWTIAVFTLDIPGLNLFLLSVYAYLPNVLAAIVILALAMAASTAVSVGINRLMGDTPTGRIISTGLPVIILSISVFAILEQLKIAPTIVTITYAALIGSLALGFAIAFGLGGQDVAARIFEDAYSRGRENIGQMKEDIAQGKRRGQEEVNKAKRNMR
jgi:hypothetical protein